MRKVAIIGTNGIPPRNERVETSVYHILNELKMDFSFTVYCCNRQHLKQEKSKTINNIKLIHVPFRTNRKRFFYDFYCLLHSLFYADTILIFGVTIGILLPFIRLFSRKKIIVNIDKLQWRKNENNRIIKYFLQFSEKIALRFSHANVTDNELIKRYILIKHKKLSLLIEYGGDHNIYYGRTKNHLKKYPFLKYAYAFKVAKIVPENNIELILNAFSITQQHIVIVSNWDNNDYAIQLKKRYYNYSNIHLVDLIYSQEELDTIRRNCVLYIHGNDTERTSLPLIEAMSLGLPVVTFSTNANRAATENSAFYYNNVQDLIKIIKTIKYYDYINNSLKMKEIASRRYTWKLIALKYKDLLCFLDHDYSASSTNTNFSSLKDTYLQKRGLAHLKKLGSNGD